MKFSIIVPVYNVSSYIEKCLLSLKKQQGNHFEVLVVNDGSTDNSLEIIKKCVGNDKRFTIYTKENGGLSDARNYGIERAKGEYLLFVDGDDFVHKDYIKTLEGVISSYEPDMIRFQAFRYYYENNTSEICLGDVFSLKGMDAFRRLCGDNYFVTAWIYAYKRSFFEKYHFRYEKGRNHEDFGLTPYVVLKASEVISIPNALYYYVERDGSITTSGDTDKIRKRVEDAFYLYDKLMEKVENDNEIGDDDKAFVYSYLSNAMLGMGKRLPRDVFQFYIGEINSRKISSYLLEDSIGRKIKKVLSMYFTTFYIKYFAK